MRKWILSACTARCGTLILRQLWVSMGTFWETISTRQWVRSNRYFRSHEVLFGTSVPFGPSKPSETLGIW